MVSRISAITVAFAFAAFASAQYSITDLGVLPGGTSSHAYDINEAGDVVGFSRTPNGARAFVWDRTNGMRNLGTLRNDPSSFALGINDSSSIAGFSGSNVMRTGFDWARPTGLRDLGTYNNDEISLGMDISNQGQVVGVSGFDQGVRRAFLYDPTAGMTDLGTLSGHDGAFARGINTSTQVVGHTMGSSPVAFLWNGSMQALPNLLGGTSSTAFAINDPGAAVGWATDVLGVRHAVVWDNANIIPQPIDGRFNYWEGSEALDINSSGQVVGFGMFESQEEAFIYDPRLGTVTLSEALGATGSGWSLQKAQGINDSGQIVGYGMINGEVRGFIATPVPEPASSLAFLAGAALFGLRKRRMAKHSAKHG